MSVVSVQAPRSKSSSATEVLRLADAAAGAAHGDVGADEALLALRRAWACLQATRQPGEGDPDDADTLARLIRRELTRRLPDAAAKHAVTLIPHLLERPHEAVELDHAGVALHVQVLRAAALDPVRHHAARFATLFVAGCTLAAIVAVLIGFVQGPSGPWQGHFFNNRDFDGEARVRHARKLEFDWGRDNPMRGITRDDFSIIWRTCLELEEPAKISFRLSSDDGSRLYVGPRLLIDNWGARPTRTRSGSTELDAGAHLLRVDYFEASHGANLELLASFDGGPVESIPIEMLSRPEAGNEPCG